MVVLGTGLMGVAAAIQELRCDPARPKEMGIQRNGLELRFKEGVWETPDPFDCRWMAAQRPSGC